MPALRPPIPAMLVLGTAAVIVLVASCGFPEFAFGPGSPDATVADDPEAGPSIGPGTCGPDCGPCDAGRCQPVTLYADKDGGPGGIYVNDLGVVHFTQYYGGRVVRVLPDGGTSFVAENLAYPVRVTGSVQGTFATASGEGDAAVAQIVIVSASGKSRRIVAGPTVAGLPIAPWGIVDTGRLVVWTNALPDGSVMVAAQDGRSPALLATGGRPEEITANAEHVWWVDAEHSRLYRRSFSDDAGAPVLVTTDFVDYVTYGGGKLYTASATNTSSIGVLDDPAAVGGSVRELVSRYVRLPGTDAPAVNSPHGIAVDDAYVYWVNSPVGGAAGSVVRVRMDGTAPPELLADGMTRPDQIAVTATGIYWTSFTGTVQRLPKP